MRLRVDGDWCQGHSRCLAMFPDWFDVNDEGIAVVTADEIFPESRERAHDAVAICPERAIHLDEEP